MRKMPTSWKNHRQTDKRDRIKTSSVTVYRPMKGKPTKLIGGHADSDDDSV